ncbi:cellulose binding domain-containing protein [Polymorphospora sp. NPDC050346]|uniref:pectate lyase family protein n=1 Tax=Polymorphospora sp. NPDC050346 TaxID=3155780 RepID=UPI0033CF5A31
MKGNPTRRRVVAVLGTALTVTLVTGVLTAVSAQAAAGCQVTYTTTGQWPGGFTANISIRNLGDPVDGWRFGWTFPAGQTITNAWGFTASATGGTVTATNVGYNAALPTNASTDIGFNGTWNNVTNPAPAAFTLNGTTCTGTVNPTPPATTPPPTSAPPTTPPPTTPPPTSPPSAGPIGWAAQGGGTTGGGNTAPTTVDNLSALRAAAASTAAAVIRVSGTISCTGMLNVRSNKTIVGNAGATIVGCGLNISGSTNVIVRNLTFRGWNDDAINIQASSRVWIDHLTLSNGADGAIDIKEGSDYVTVSWNRIFDHHKALLLGHDDDNGAQDRGKLRVTYHHNWFDGTVTRNPMVRFGNPVHVFNNYYDGVASYGVRSLLGAGVLVEGNYFENTKDPFHRGVDGTLLGNIVARNNTFVGSGSGTAGGGVAAIPYTYPMDPPGSVKSIVQAGAGAGRVTA